MEKEFWLGRWQEGTTPWDIGKAHPRIEEVGEVLKDSGVVRGLVPGCGNAHAGEWLRRKGYDVIAFDYVEEAIESARKTYPDFPKENLIVADALAGDAFEENRFEFIYDRAMLCALAPKDRKQYMNNCRSWLKKDGLWTGFIFTERAFDQEKGPPFQLTASEFMDLVKGTFVVEDVREYPYFDEDHVIKTEAMIVAKAI